MSLSSHSLLPRSSSNPSSSSTSDADAAILKILDLDEIDRNLYRGYSPANIRWGRVYGGQTVAQALVAAGSTVDDPYIAHSLHAYFLRPGDDNLPILYQVERLRDGFSFISRRVTAIQAGLAIFTMSVSFQQPEVGLEHQELMPSVPEPESLPSLMETLYKWSEDSRLNDRVRAGIKRSISFPFPMDLRRIHPNTLSARLTPGQDPEQSCWMKVTGKLSDSLLLHQCCLAYLSDWSLLETSLLPHGVHSYQNNNEQVLQIASICHSMWFHESFRADDYLLYVMNSPRASAGRGLAFGKFFRRDGKLVVSCAQEGLIRVRKGPFERPQSSAANTKTILKNTKKTTDPIQKKESTEKGQNNDEKNSLAPSNNYTLLPAKL